MKSINLILFSSFLALSACGQSTKSVQNISSSADQKRFETACVEELKENLKAPASFILVEARHEHSAYVLGDGELENDRKRLDDIERLDDNSGGKGLDIVMEEFDLKEKLRHLDVPASDRPKPIVFSASIDYDAQNSFGALLRGHATCEYHDWNGQFDEHEFPMTLKLEMG